MRPSSYPLSRTTLSTLVRLLGTGGIQVNRCSIAGPMACLLAAGSVVLVAPASAGSPSGSAGIVERAPAASSPGVITAPKAVRAKLLRDIGVEGPARCYSVLVAMSSSRWASFSTSSHSFDHQDECSPFDGMGVYRKLGGTWVNTGVAGSSIRCNAFRSALREAGAPKSVVKDFAATFFCPR